MSYTKVWVFIEKNYIRFKTFILERILIEKNERKLLEFFIVSKLNCSNTIYARKIHETSLLLKRYHLKTYSFS